MTNNDVIEAYEYYAKLGPWIQVNMKSDPENCKYLFALVAGIQTIGEE